MRQSSLSIALAVLLTGAVVLAQTHSNTTEKKASDEMTFQSDVKVGSHLLKAGRYVVSCDSKTIKFSLITMRAGERLVNVALEVPCQGKALAERRLYSGTAMPLNKDGVLVLEKLYLRGSNVEHIFPN